MATYIKCKSCGKLIPVEAPRGSVNVSGNVGIGSGVKLDGGVIRIGPGEGIRIGAGGKIGLGAPSSISVSCSNCGFTGTYSTSDILEK